MVKIESKEKLAKLLAVEDLDVQHRQVKTAMFDIHNRCIILPVWKDMPNHLYDLLLGHEVGHALYTPTDMDRLAKINKETSHDCINVIEDARIEKLIKNKYPGLRRQFFRGYDHLNKEDFFDVKNKIINEQPFLDRINLHFKLNQRVEVSFNNEEQKLVTEISECRTFEDVEKVARKVHKYIMDNEIPASSNEPTEQPPTDFKEDEFGENYGETSEMTDEEGDEEEGADEDGEEENGGEDDDEDYEEKPKTEEEELDEAYSRASFEGGEDSTLPQQMDEDESFEDQNDNDPVKSKTQRAFDERISDFAIIDKNIKYISVPDQILNFDHVVVDYKEVHRNITSFYHSMEHPYWKKQSYHNTETHKMMRQRVYDKAHHTLNKFKKECVKNVNHLAMDFERKKAADVYKRTLITKTGILDTNKMFSAAYNDDVFKKNVRVADGKNHGLVMFVDWSGSMAENLFGTIRQLIELSMFCKKVKIPFEVYSFTERGGDYYEDDGSYRKTEPVFKFRHGDLVTDRHLGLRNLLSGRMSTKEFNEGLLNLCILANRHNYGFNCHYEIPVEEQLHGTPLNGCILLSEYIIKAFQQKNNLANVNAVFLTDGEANGHAVVYDGGKGASDCIQRKYDVLYLQDKKTKKNHKIGSSGGMQALTPALFDVVKSRLDINIVGFYIIPKFTPSTLWRFTPKKNPTSHKSYMEGKEQFRSWITTAKRKGYFIKEESGYDEYFVIQGMQKPVVGEINESMTKRKMASIFSKQNNQFKNTRVILTRFIDLITA